MTTEIGTRNSWLIVGLGNPGTAYQRTRHNLGFMVVDLIAAEEQTQVKRDECRALVGRAMIGGTVVELAKPQTFMNLSGDAVSCLIAKPGRGIENLIVISDDLALPLGSIRLRPKGTHGGHNGLRSIIERLGTNDFIRLRIGIMPEHPVSNTRDFVLQNFAKNEAEKVESVLKRSAEAVRTVISVDVEKAMAEFN
ncbi:MAG: aminoacyl-tRNA hydrolase [Pyrinomonadaceae bacterium]